MSAELTAGQTDRETTQENQKELNTSESEEIWKSEEKVGNSEEGRLKRRRERSGKKSIQMREGNNGWRNKMKRRDRGRKLIRNGKKKEKKGEKAAVLIYSGSNVILLAEEQR